MAVAMVYPPLLVQDYAELVTTALKAQQEQPRITAEVWMCTVLQDQEHHFLLIQDTIPPQLQAVISVEQVKRYVQKDPTVQEVYSISVLVVHMVTRRDWQHQNVLDCVQLVITVQKGRMIQQHMIVGDQGFSVQKVHLFHYQYRIVITLDL